VQKTYFSASWVGSLPSPAAHRGWKVVLLFIQRFEKEEDEDEEDDDE
jgi:hypothetical protein